MDNSLSDHSSYPALPAISTGIKGRCPRCGEGKLFDGLLNPAKGCNACGLNFDFIDAGDGPTVFVIMLLGFLVLGMALIVEFSYQPPFWLHMVLWIPVITVLGLLITRVIKGILIVLQFQNDAGTGQLVSKQD